MTKNVYIVQSWVIDSWVNVHCYSSVKKAKHFISDMAFQGHHDYRIFTMSVL